ncbi:PREDICTED: putative uncharacterized protein encoded by LINC00337 [Galeopterus variegatus]|uniref:Uncharacterized protein n=1 Tax=Galeopterus variegatus TaxID=482537 RepID=A0ABM0QA56_GALVR|nr:PREDICTED: putative uncharacterized protein encoded by LINC00337 [Galeopterus variegatus]
MVTEQRFKVLKTKVAQLQCQVGDPRPPLRQNTSGPLEGARRTFPPGSELGPGAKKHFCAGCAFALRTVLSPDLSPGTVAIWGA